MYTKHIPQTIDCIQLHYAFASSEHLDDFKKSELQQMCHKSSIQIHQIQTV